MDDITYPAVTNFDVFNLMNVAPHENCMRYVAVYMDGASTMCVTFYTCKGKHFKKASLYDVMRAGHISRNTKKILNAMPLYRTLLQLVAL